MMELESKVRWGDRKRLARIKDEYPRRKSQLLCMD